MSEVLGDEHAKPAHLIIEVSRREPARRDRVAAALIEAGYRHCAFDASNDTIPVSRSPYEEMYFARNSPRTSEIRD